MLEREFLSIIDWRLFCTRELLQSYYVNLVRTHSRGLFKVGDETTEESLDVTSHDDAGSSASHQLDVDETDSTAHPTSSACSTPSATEDNDEMRSESEAEVEFQADKGVEETQTPEESKFLEVVTPRTAAKRRAGSVGELYLADERLRSRGRRRLADG